MIQKEDSLISIIVPCYNAAGYINKCLDSILAQTYTNIEVILIDDGSTDDTGKILDAYKEQDPRIVVVHQENRGPAATRNVGLDIAKGEYIAFVDSDDYVLPDFCEKRLQYFTGDISMVLTGLIKVDTEGKELSRRPKNISEREMDSDELYKLLLCGTIKGFLPGVMVKKTVVGDMRLDESLRFMEDWGFILQLCFNNRFRIRLVDYYGYFYVNNEGSLVHKRTQRIPNYEYLDSSLLDTLPDSDQLRYRKIKNYITELVIFSESGSKDKSVIRRNISYIKKNYKTVRPLMKKNEKTRARLLKIGYPVFDLTEKVLRKTRKKGDKGNEAD